MKKIITGLATLAVLASTASADFARVEMGAGAWGQTPSGTLSYSDNGATGFYTSNKKEDTNAYFWMLIKHPIPVIPNIRLEYAGMNDSGIVEGAFNGFTAPANTPATLNMTQYDIIPYYNLLDNTFWMTVDLGLDIKIINTDYSASGVTLTGSSLGLNTETYNDSTSLAIPLGYLRARVEIPVTNIGVETDIKYISYGSSTASDFRAKIDYTFDFVPVVQPAIEVGYRMQHFDLESDDKKTKMKMDYSGVYAGLMLRF